MIDTRKWPRSLGFEPREGGCVVRKRGCARKMAAPKLSQYAPHPVSGLCPVLFPAEYFAGRA